MEKLIIIANLIAAVINLATALIQLRLAKKDKD